MSFLTDYLDRTLGRRVEASASARAYSPGEYNPHLEEQNRARRHQTIRSMENARAWEETPRARSLRSVLEYQRTVAEQEREPQFEDMPTAARVPLSPFRPARVPENLSEQTAAEQHNEREAAKSTMRRLREQLSAQGTGWNENKQRLVDLASQGRSIPRQFTEGLTEDIREQLEKGELVRRVGVLPPELEKKTRLARGVAYAVPTLAAGAVGATIGSLVGGPVGGMYGGLKGMGTVSETLQKLDPEGAGYEPTTALLGGMGQGAAIRAQQYAGGPVDTNKSLGQLYLEAHPNAPRAEVEAYENTANLALAHGPFSLGGRAVRGGRESTLRERVGRGGLGAALEGLREGERARPGPIDLPAEPRAQAKPLTVRERLEHLRSGEREPQQSTSEERGAALLRELEERQGLGPAGRPRGGTVMGMEKPIPSRARVRVLGKQFAKGTSARAFETPEGDVIRVGPILDRPKSPDILQATSRRIQGEMMEERLPKVKMGDVTIEEMAALEERLNAQGLTMVDFGTENVGRTHDGRVVVVDPGAVAPMGSKSTGLEGDVATWKRAYSTLTPEQLTAREAALERRRKMKEGEIEELPTDDPEFYHVKTRLDAIRELQTEQARPRKGSELPSAAGPIHPVNPYLPESERSLAERKRLSDFMESKIGVDRIDDSLRKHAATDPGGTVVGYEFDPEGNFIIKSQGAKGLIQESIIPKDAPAHPGYGTSYEMTPKEQAALSSAKAVEGDLRSAERSKFSSKYNGVRDRLEEARSANKIAPDVYSQLKKAWYAAVDSMSEEKVKAVAVQMERMLGGPTTAPRSGRQAYAPEIEGSLRSEMGLPVHQPAEQARPWKGREFPSGAGEETMGTRGGEVPIRETLQRKGAWWELQPPRGQRRIPQEQTPRLPEHPYQEDIEGILAKEPIGEAFAAGRTPQPTVSRMSGRGMTPGEMQEAPLITHPTGLPTGEPQAPVATRAMGLIQTAYEAGAGPPTPAAPMPRVRVIRKAVPGEVPIATGPVFREEGAEGIGIAPPAEQRTMRDILETKAAEEKAALGKKISKKQTKEDIAATLGLAEVPDIELPGVRGVDPETGKPYTKEQLKLKSRAEKLNPLEEQIRQSQKRQEYIRQLPGELGGEVKELYRKGHDDVAVQRYVEVRQQNVAPDVAENYMRTGNTNELPPNVRVKTPNGELTATEAGAVKDATTPPPPPEPPGPVDNSTWRPPSGGKDYPVRVGRFTNFLYHLEDWVPDLAKKLSSAVFSHKSRMTAEVAASNKFFGKLSKDEQKTVSKWLDTIERPTEADHIQQMKLSPQQASGTLMEVAQAPAHMRDAYDFAARKLFEVWREAVQKGELRPSQFIRSYFSHMGSGEFFNTVVNLDPWKWRSMDPAAKQAYEASITKRITDSYGTWAKEWELPPPSQLVKEALARLKKEAPPRPEVGTEGYAFEEIPFGAYEPRDGGSIYRKDLMKTWFSYMNQAIRRNELGPIARAWKEVEPEWVKAQMPNKAAYVSDMIRQSAGQHTNMLDQWLSKTLGPKWGGVGHKVAGTISGLINSSALALKPMQLILQQLDLTKFGAVTGSYRSPIALGAGMKTFMGKLFSKQGRQELALNGILDPMDIRAVDEGLLSKGVKKAQAIGMSMYRLGDMNARGTSWHGAEWLWDKGHVSAKDMAKFGTKQEYARWVSDQVAVTFNRATTPMAFYHPAGKLAYHFWHYPLYDARVLWGAAKRGNWLGLASNIAAKTAFMVFLNKALGYGWNRAASVAGGGSISGAPLQAVATALGGNVPSGRELLQTISPVGESPEVQIVSDLAKMDWDDLRHDAMNLVPFGGALRSLADLYLVQSEGGVRREGGPMRQLLPVGKEKERTPRRTSTEAESFGESVKRSFFRFRPQVEEDLQAQERTKMDLDKKELMLKRDIVSALQANAPELVRAAFDAYQTEMGEPVDPRSVREALKRAVRPESTKHQAIMGSGSAAATRQTFRQMEPEKGSTEDLLQFLRKRRQTRYMLDQQEREVRTR